MPRVSEAEKSKSRARILEAGARLFREQGVEATSVADVMSAAGLTHGGFYRHFASKEEMAAAAFRHAVDTVVAGIERATLPEDRARAQGDYFAAYLSGAHVGDRGHGCPLAAIGGEAVRHEGPLRGAAAEALWRMVELLGRCDGAAAPRRDGRALALMSLLLGAVTLARLTETQGEADDVLSAGRTGVEALLECWPHEVAGGEME